MTFFVSLAVTETTAIMRQMRSVFVINIFWGFMKKPFCFCSIV